MLLRAKPISWGTFLIRVIFASLGIVIPRLLLYQLVALQPLIEKDVSHNEQQRGSEIIHQGGVEDPKHARRCGHGHPQRRL